MSSPASPVSRPSISESKFSLKAGLGEWLERSDDDFGGGGDGGECMDRESGERWSC